VALALADMPPDLFEALQQLLARAGGRPTGGASRADADLERALILKAVGARRALLRASRLDEIAKERGPLRATQAERALAEIRAFAEEIRGERREELVRSTTLIDVDSKHNTSRADPLDLLEVDTDADNDGLYQRYESSCAPTMAQLVLGEADPIFARALQRERGDPGPGSAAARQQRAVLTAARFVDAHRSNAPRELSPEEGVVYRKTGRLPPGVRYDGGNSTLRAARQHRARVAAWAREARLEDDVRAALAQYLDGARLSRKSHQRAQQALRAVRRRHGGAPSSRDVELMRANPTQPEHGMWIHKALALIAEPGAGGRRPRGGFTARPPRAPRRRASDAALSNWHVAPCAFRLGRAIVGASTLRDALLRATARGRP
jgi:hypothetical protein